LQDEDLLTEKDINSIDDKMKDLQRKRKDGKRTVDEILKNPGKF